MASFSTSALLVTSFSMTLSFSLLTSVIESLGNFSGINGGVETSGNLRLAINLSLMTQLFPSLSIQLGVTGRRARLGDSRR